MKYKNYIWDLGGTLLDNYESSTRAFEETLRKYNIFVSHDDIYQALKKSTDYAVNKFARNIPDFLKQYKEAEKVLLEEPILFDGASEVLEYIVQSGGKNFMISHRDNHVLDILESAGIAEYFTEVVTSDSDFPRKPNPQSVKYLIDKYNLTNALMIGDRLLDIEAAQKAGITSMHFGGDLEIASDYHIASLDEIKEIK